MRRWTGRCSRRMGGTIWWFRRTGRPTTEGEKQALARFEDEVIDRLFALNATRAAEERAARAEGGDGGGREGEGRGGRKKKGDAGSPRA
jgi:hypothetical protein